MAKASSTRVSPAGGTQGAAAPELPYAGLLASGVDMSAMIAEYLAESGASGILALAEALSAAPMASGTRDAVSSLVACEALKGSVTAKQVDCAVAYQDSLIAERREAGIRERNPAWGSGGDIALAMHLPPTRGSQVANDCRILAEDLTRCLEGLRQGLLTWEQVQVVIRGTRNLQVESRRMVDRLLWEETHTCFEAGTAKLREMVTYWALVLEPATEEDLEAKAEKDRYVDAYQVDAHRMKICGMVPLAMGIPLTQVLARERDRAQQDPDDDRSPGQVAADTFYEAITGLKPSGGAVSGLVVVMDAETLAQTAENPALLPGYGYISASLGRRLLAGDPDDPFETWMRRLFVAPETGQLVGMDSRSRRFTGNLKRFIGLRDQYCRTPYCNGKIRELDHVKQVRKKGKTSAANSSGRCRHCNRTKEAPGWIETPVPGDRHSFRITTPSGQTYISKAPPSVGTAPPAGSRRPSAGPGRRIRRE